ncbi:aldehyde dehydrogenase family protein [Rheinheimera sp.]|uniref:aldehyde dehydrogenase family protein n=1 Tax=Rheinheimera sp. TaxID=1869214 RepID=UPI00307D8F59
MNPYQTPFQQQQQYFASGASRSLQWRRQQLQAMRQMLQNHQQEWQEALQQDLGKAPFESWLTEIAYLDAEIRHTLKQLKKWSKARRVKAPLMLWPSMAYVQPEPYGVMLIIGAWNYPLQLALGPLVPAIAAGNMAVIKPSELSPATSALIARLIPRYLDAQAVQVVEGGVAETTALLELPFDYLMYTGNGQVGKIVMRAAAEHLTPVTLELGGKSPVYVDASANIPLTAQRLAWGKWLNAGQTCIAPDYVLVHKDVEAQLIEALQQQIKQMFGDDPQQSPDYGRIVNSRHMQRILGYLQHQPQVLGGKTDETDRYIEPTLVLEPAVDSPLMQQEIFGPVLPILKVSHYEQALEFIRRREKPLAAYLFSADSQQQQQWVDRISSGSQCINDVILFMAVAELPFGGTGPSGMGQYSGKAGFDQFSHLKSVLRRTFLPEPPLRFAPYQSWKQRVLGWLR